MNIVGTKLDKVKQLANYYAQQWWKLYNKRTIGVSDFYTQHSGHSIPEDGVRLVMKFVLLFLYE